MVNIALRTLYLALVGNQRLLKVGNLVIICRDAVFGVWTPVREMLPVLKLGVVNPILTLRKLQINVGYLAYGEYDLET